MKKLRLPLVAVLLCVIGSALRADGPDINSTRRYTTRGYLKQIVLSDTTAHPHSYLGGNAQEGQFQFWVLAVDSIGDTVWNSRLGTTDQLLGMTRSSAGDELVAVGHTYESGSMDFRHVRLLLDGGTEVSIDQGTPDTTEQLTAVSSRVGDSTHGEFALGEVRPGSGDGDVVVRSLSTTGAINGHRTFAQARLGAAIGTFRDAAGSIRVQCCGTADSLAGRSRDFWLAVTDSLLTDSTAIERRFGGTRDEICHDAVRLSANLTIMVGTTHSFGDTTNGNIWVLATNDSGDSLWSRSWAGAGIDIANAVCATVDFDSGFVIAGSTRATATARQRGILAKYSRQGDSLWTVYMDADSGVVLNDVAQDRGFHYRAVGGAFTGPVQYGFFAVTDADPHSPGQHPPNRFSLLSPGAGDTVTSDTIRLDWEDATEPDGETVRYALLVDSDTLFQSPVQVFGPLSVSRYTWPADSDGAEIYWRVIAQDEHGLTRVCEERQWSFLRLLPDSTQPFDLAHPDSGLALPEAFAEFNWTRAVDADAHDPVTYTVHFQTADTAVAMPAISDTFMIVSFANNPLFPEVSPVTWWVTAASEFPVMTRDSRQRWSFITWSAGAEPASALPLEFGLTRAYPNPFNATVTLEFALDRPQATALEIFDLQGRLVDTVVAAFMSAGSYRLQWDGARHGSGVYFARLRANGRLATLKLNLVK